MTGILVNPLLGGQGVADYAIKPGKALANAWPGYSAQLLIQAEMVLMTLVWSGLGSLVIYFIIDKTMGLRPTEEAEQIGLDLSDHGERAYNYGRAWGGGGGSSPLAVVTPNQVPPANHWPETKVSGLLFWRGVAPACARNGRRALRVGSATEA
jgi:hypothetical protein